LGFAGLILSRFTLHFGYIDEDKKQAAELIEQFQCTAYAAAMLDIYETGSNSVGLSAYL